MRTNSPGCTNLVHLIWVALGAQQDPCRARVSVAGGRVEGRVSVLFFPRDKSGSVVESVGRLVGRSERIERVELVSGFGLLFY